MGTIRYWPPKLFSKTYERSPEWLMSIDIWSFGATLWMMAHSINEDVIENLNEIKMGKSIMKVMMEKHKVFISKSNYEYDINNKINNFINYVLQRDWKN